MKPDDHEATLYPFTPPPPPPGALPSPRRRRTRIGKTAAGLALVLGTGAGAATVALATATGSTPALAASDSTSTTVSPAAPPGPCPARRWAGPMRGALAWGPGMSSPGAAGGIVHSTYTVKGSDGKYETIDVQTGTAEVVSATSVTVKSADGFSQSYAITPSTIVEARQDGILSVKVGDEVSIRGLVGGSAVNAERVVDLTQLRAGAAVTGPWGRRPGLGGMPGGEPGGGPPAA
jgi:hypothetical protein